VDHNLNIFIAVSPQAINFLLKVGDLEGLARNEFCFCHA